MAKKTASTKTFEDPKRYADPMTGTYIDLTKNLPKAVEESVARPDPVEDTTNDELNSQALLEFERGCDDFKRGKGTGWSTFSKWVTKKYPYVNFKYKTNGKNCIKGLKLVSDTFSTPKTAP